MMCVCGYRMRGGGREREVGEEDYAWRGREGREEREGGKERDRTNATKVDGWVMDPSQPTVLETRGFP